MDKIESHNPSPLKPHTYPKWVIVAGAIVLCVCLYGLYVIPKYYYAIQALRAGSSAYDNRDFDKAIESFQRAIALVPTATAPKIAIAEAYFANENKDDDALGLLHLNNVELNSRQWARLTKVMPVEYQQNFTESVKKNR